MLNKKIILPIITIIIFITICINLLNKKVIFNIDVPISTYNLSNDKTETAYLNYIKERITPIELKQFIETYYVPMSLLNDKSTGYDVLVLMKMIAYEELFKSLFDKSRTNFSDCPVSDNFKNKFNVNLIDYFNLYAADDYNVNCNLDMENKNFTIEIYGIEGYSENLEPNYRNTYNFHYTLDDEENVDNIELIEIEKQ